MGEKVDKKCENETHEITCDTCDWNDDNLCDKIGRFIHENDEACNKYEHNEKE